MIKTNYKVLSSDLDTPVSLYAKFAEYYKDIFLFESVIGSENIGRFSFLGFRSLDLIQSFDTDISDPYVILQEKLSQNISKNELGFFHKGYVGFFGFQSIGRFEPSLKTKNSKLPEAYLMLPGSVIVIDHACQKLYLIDHYEDSESESLSRIDRMIEIIKEKTNLERLEIINQNQIIEFDSNMGKEAYKEMVIKAKEHIYEGDVFQLVPSHKLSTKSNVNIIELYRRLRTKNPSPYMFIFNFGTQTLIGSSPESLIKTFYKNDKLFACVKPIAGTYKRGNNDNEDDNLIQKLIQDPKEKAEHVMLIDLARNDLGKVCKAGSVKVVEKMNIEKYSHVMHIVSSVIGELKENSIAALQACFPAGTLSGAPKIEAIKILQKLETTPRDIYGGCIGYFAFDGLMDTAITIRTLLVNQGELTIQVGAGIVADSNPDEEWEETLNKARALMEICK